MQTLMVILDGSEDSWAAVFTGYDLAVRSGARLMGMIPVALGDREAARLLIDFRTGARAAGVPYRTGRSRLENGAPALEDVEGAAGMLVGKTHVDVREKLEALLAALPCPLWVIPSHGNLRQAVLIEGRSRPSDALHRFADSLSRNWGWQVEAHGVDPADEAGTRREVEALVGAAADLYLLEWPELGGLAWELLQRSDRPVVLVPSP